MSRKKIILGGATVLAMVLLAALLLAPGRDSSIDPALPHPNGYELIRQASAMVNLRDLLQMGAENSASLSRLELETRMREYQLVLDMARRGLALPGRVPMLPDLSDLGRHSTTTLALQNLSILFSLEGRLRELQGDFDGAAQSYLDMARLGPATSRGGLAGDLTGGLAMARLGADRLLAVSPELDPIKRRALAEALREQINRFPSMSENEANERELFTRRASFGKKVSMLISRRLPVWQSGVVAMRAQAARGLVWLRQRAAELSSEVDSPDAK